MAAFSIRRRHAGSLGAVIALVFAVFACGEIRPDEIECEEAVSHLQNCCAGLDPRGFNCVYQETCGTTLRPSFTVQTSQCIRGEKCADLESSGTCARAIAGEFLPDVERGPGSAFDEGVCR